MNIESYDSDKHVVNRFDCGANPLNVFLKNKAKSRSKRLEYKVVVATLDGSPNCIGYYALQVGSDSIPESSKYKQKDYATNYPAFPAINLTYLAVQGQGLGEYLLNHIFAAVGIMVEHVGFYALTVQSFDEKSTKFYEKIGFKEYSEGGGQPKMLYPVTSIIQILENHPQRN